MSTHYVIAADAGHLRFFQRREDPEQLEAALDPIQALDFPSGVKSYTSEEADMAGRFQNSRIQTGGAGAPGARGGMSIDERLPLQREVERKRVRDIAQAINAFMQKNRDATWDFAAAPTLLNATLEEIEPEIRGRLQKTLNKDIVNQSAPEIRQHFARMP